MNNINPPISDNNLKKFMLNISTIKRQLLIQLRWPHLLSKVSLIIFLIFIISSTAQLINNGDFWFHLSIGRYIFDTHKIPVTEFFSHTANGALWVSHSWLYELILYIVYRMFSWNGIVVLKVLCALATYLILYKITKLYKIPTLLSVGLLTLIHAAIVQLWMDRPQIISYFLTSLLLLILLIFNRNNVGTKKIVLLPLLFILWGNLHAGVLIGLMLLFIFWIIEGWSRFSNLTPPSVKTLRTAFLKGKAGLLFSAGIISFLAGLINPNFYRSYLYFFIVNPGFQNRFLAEWKSVFIHLNDPHIQFYFIFMILALIVLIIDYSLMKKPIDKIQIVLFSFALVFGLDALRNITLFCILSLPVIAISLEHITSRASTSKSIPRLPIMRGVCIFVILFLFIRIQLIMGFPQIGVDWTKLPVGATNFLKENASPHTIYNPYHLGGFLMWTLYPNYRIFIDSRWDPYVKSVFLDYQKVAMADPDFTNVLDRYQTDLVLIQNSDTWGRWQEIGSFLENSDNWFPIYYDDFATIFLRDKPGMSDALKALGYQSVLLYDETEVALSSQIENAIVEYNRIIETSPSASSSAYNRLGFLYTTQKRWDLARKQFEHSIANNPLYASPYYNIGRSYEEESGDYNRAIEFYEKASELGFHAATLRLAELYENQFKYSTKAIEYYSRAISSSSNKDEIISLRSKIAYLKSQNN